MVEISIVLQLIVTEYHHLILIYVIPVYAIEPINFVQRNVLLENIQNILSNHLGFGVADI